MTHVAVVGAGPAGLIAAETLASAGVAVSVYERMPSVGRKLLMAGRGGLNLTHSEVREAFVDRYGGASERLRPFLEAFSPTDLVDWCEGLGQRTFVGSSGRVFPKAMKASPLLRAWLARLDAMEVRILTRHAWRGWDATGALRFESDDGQVTEGADAVILALGGASWPRLGSDGAWTDLLQSKGVRLAPFRPANCGFVIPWSSTFRDRFAGQPLKGLAFGHRGRSVRGEAVVTGYGVEGGGVYALSASLRDAIEADGQTVLHIDLRPDTTADTIARRLASARAGESVANRLRKAVRLSPLEVNLMREAGPLPSEGAALASAVKNVRLTLLAPQSLERSISTAGGVALEEVDDSLMLRRLPGVFVAGEMLDWEAPTGGYLLQASFATGVAAAKGVLGRLGIQPATARAAPAR